MNAFADSNVVTTQYTVICYTNDICTEGDGSPEGYFRNSNGCCGDVIFAPYYRTDNGSCSPCT